MYKILKDGRMYTSITGKGDLVRVFKKNKKNMKMSIPEMVGRGIIQDGTSTKMLCCHAENVTATVKYRECPLYTT